MSLANWWKRSGTRLIPINSTDITSLSFHPASLMDKHTGLLLPYRNSFARGSRYPLVIRLAERGMGKRYMGGSCRYHQVLIFSFPDTRRWYGVDFGMSMEDFPVKSPCPTGPVSCIVRSWMNIACCFIVGYANPGYMYPR